jgi:hypothetical protein
MAIWNPFAILRRFFSNNTARRKAKKLKASSEKFRKLSPVELVKIGLSPKAERYAPAVFKRIKSEAETISKRRFLQKQLVEKTGEHLSLEQAAARRKNETLSYSSAAAENQADKQRRTRLRKTLGTRASKLDTITDYKGRAYRPSDERKAHYIAARDRKLAGEWFESNDYFALLDMAAAVKDPALPLLKQSPETIRYL